MGALNRKLMRDLWRLKGQIFAVALVIASGTALLVMSLSTLSSLQITADAYYERYRFAEVFAGLKRAPERIADRIAEIPGVQVVETRVVAYSVVDVPDFAGPVTALLVSHPETGEPTLNRLALSAGRLPGPGGNDEVVVLKPFAEAHDLKLGDRFSVLLNGVKRPMRVVGTALSPEFVYAIAPGGMMPDDEQFGVIWMGRKALAAAYDLDGAFNDVSLGLLRGAEPEPVIEALDALIERYGATGAVARADQISNWFLMNEFKQMRTMAVILPTIFLAIAAYLSYMVIGRLIATERREIALMKAFGYSGAEVGWHYAKLALAMAAVGIAIGWVAGAALGRYNTQIYADLFSFPFLFYRPGPEAFVLSAGVAVAVALLGSLGAVRRAAALPPAEAMRPPAPEVFRHTAVPAAVARRLDSPTRMILRQIARTPARSAMTTSGVALSVGVLVMAMQWSDGITYLAHSNFNHSQHQDMTVGFSEVRAAEARLELARLPGVMAVEPQRTVSADLSSGTRSHRGAITGLPVGARMQVIHDVRGWELPVTPSGGLVIGTMLAEKLGVGIGDEIDVEVLHRDHPRFRLPVSAVFETYIALPAYMELDQLNRRLGDPPVFGHAGLIVDRKREGELFAAVREIPGFSALLIKRAALQQFFDTIGETILIFISFFVIFSCALAYGVIYNAARIALSERGRELATLRVLGFTRWEISYILIGETAFLVLLALPLGCLAGYGLIGLMVQSFETELYRFPFVVHPSAFGKAMLVVLAASVVSAAIVRRRLDRLDLVAVLKTRE